MFVRLLKKRSYRGVEYEEGSIIDATPSLAGQMILNGVGARSSEEEFLEQEEERQKQEEGKQKQEENPLESLKKDELIIKAKELGLKIEENLKKDEIIAKIKEVLDNNA